MHVLEVTPEPQHPITLGIPVLRRYDLLLQSVTSALAGSVKPAQVAIIDNGQRMPEHITRGLLNATQQAGANLLLTAPRRSLGVGASWNLLLREFDDYLIIANDDTVFYRQTIERLVRAAEARPDLLFLYPGGGGPKNAWSLFLQRRASLAEVGFYDEQLSPHAYFEDNDYARRLALVGKPHVAVPRCGYGHVESATIAMFTREERERHAQRFNDTRERYIHKWGGPPGFERLNPYAQQAAE